MPNYAANLLFLVVTTIALPADFNAHTAPPDLRAFAPLPDLGVKQWTCDPAVMAKSKEVPKSAHSVRFADIKVIAALGDSLTAANGANARTPLGLRKEFRGLAFQIGGDMTLEERSITFPSTSTNFFRSVY
ncbi:hypothetical protein COOONC_21745, partial [Cooperia oncophora]